MLINGKRALATLRKIDEIKPIEGADFIEAVRVDGWWVVSEKGDFHIGDLSVYIEPDAWVPTDLAPFLSKGKTPHVFNGVNGERLRTARLRGQLSQGLLLNPDTIPQLTQDVLTLGTDISSILGVQKWERSVPVALRGLMRGDFPAFVPKTDQERIQNIPQILDDRDRLWEVSLKLDGSSMTIYVKDGFPGVCSRNIDLKLTADNSDNVFVRAARKNILPQLMRFYGDAGRSIALQAELMGPGVQGNRENLVDHYLYVFDIWDIDAQRYFFPYERTSLLHYFNLCTFDTDPIPTTHRYLSLKEMGINTMNDILDYPEKLGSTFFDSCAQPIEGLVFKAVDGTGSFKVINNKFLEQKCTPILGTE